MPTVSQDDRIILVFSVLCIYAHENNIENDVKCFMFILRMLLTYWETGGQVARMIWPSKMIWPLGESRIKSALATTKIPIHLLC